jgi:hypothetical protein
MQRLALATMLVLSASACAGGRPAPSPDDRTRIGAASAEQRTCSRDSECVLVDDCCGCSQGGQRLAVRGELVPSLETAADDACAARRCAPVSPQHHSCRATAARCSGGLCVPAI